MVNLLVSLWCVWIVAGVCVHFALPWKTFLPAFFSESFVYGKQREGVQYYELLTVPKRYRASLGELYRVPTALSSAGGSLTFTHGGSCGMRGCFVSLWERAVATGGCIHCTNGPSLISE